MTNEDVVRLTNDIVRNFQPRAEMAVYEDEDGESFVSTPHTKDDAVTITRAEYDALVADAQYGRQASKALMSLEGYAQSLWLGATRQGGSQWQCAARGYLKERRYAEGPTLMAVGLELFQQISAARELYEAERARMAEEAASVTAAERAA